MITIGKITFACGHQHPLRHNLAGRELWVWAAGVTKIDCPECELRERFSNTPTCNKALACFEDWLEDDAYIDEVDDAIDFVTSNFPIPVSRNHSGVWNIQNAVGEEFDD